MKSGKFASRTIMLHILSWSNGANDKHLDMVFLKETGNMNVEPNILLVYFLLENTFRLNKFEQLPI